MLNHAIQQSNRRFLLASSLDPVEEVLVVDNELTAPILGDLDKLTTLAGAQLRRVKVPHREDASDVWIQDAIEIGSWCFPDKEQGAVQETAVIAGVRSLHDGIETASLDAAVLNWFLKRDIGVACAAASRPNTRWMDWFGNLEVSPPVTTMYGKHFPFGRILVGCQNDLGMNPEVLAFLEQQGVQTPILCLDTDWLTIGHVDEIINFVPYQSSGFRALLPSVSLALSLLSIAKEAVGDGAIVFADTKTPTTVGALLAEFADSEETIRINRSLASTRDVLHRELGLSENDIIELPCLFKDGLSLVPNPVNGLVCNGHYIVPKPHGPVVEGKDIFESYILQAIAPTATQVHFMEVWETYHVHGGELHCGTNAIRRLTRSDWWTLM